MLRLELLRTVSTLPYNHFSDSNRTLTGKVSAQSALETLVVVAAKLSPQHRLGCFVNLDGDICTSSHVVNSILLHEIFGHIGLVVLIFQPTGFDQFGRRVFPRPRCAIARNMLLVAIRNILGLAHVILSTHKLKNVELLHLDGKNGFFV